MKKKNVKIIAALIIILLGIILVILGAKLKMNISNHTLLIIMLYVMGLLIALYILNLMITVRVKKRVNVKGLDHKIEVKKLFAEQNIDKYYQEIKRHLFFSDLYYLIVSLLLLSIYVILCLMAIPPIGIIAFMAGALFFSSITYIIGKDIKIETPKNELKKQDYPILWSIITKVANLFHVNKTIKCYLLFDNNAGVCIFRVKPQASRPKPQVSSEGKTARFFKRQQVVFPKTVRSHIEQKHFLNTLLT